jgi:hypothetical protein
VNAEKAAGRKAGGDIVERLEEWADHCEDAFPYEKEITDLLEADLREAMATIKDLRAMASWS